MNDHLLVAGVPGAGKSTFMAALLARGYRVLRVDEPAESAIVTPMIDLASRGEDAEALAILGPRVAVEWGFPPDTCADLVRAVLRCGYEGWWFDADPSESLWFWVRAHPGVPERYFHAQAQRIYTHRPAIEEMFAGRILRTLSDGRHLSAEEIVAAMEGVLA